MKIHKEVEFSWSSYFKPTPVNLQYWVEGIQGIIALIAADQYFAEHNKDVAFWLLVAAGSLDKLSKFFAKVAKDYQQVVTISAPPEVIDEIKVTTDKKEEPIL